MYRGLKDREWSELGWGNPEYIVMGIGLEIETFGGKESSEE